jgi:two-component system, OmpR family, phosphate regulon response regulator PhoB
VTLLSGAGGGQKFPTADILILGGSWARRCRMRRTAPDGWSRWCRSGGAGALAPKNVGSVTPLRPDFTSSTASASVLVVSSDAEVVTTAGLWLRGDGVGVAAVAAADRALDLIVARAPDAVLIDGRVTDRSGSSLCRALKGHPTFSRIAVVMIADSADAAERVRAFESGADDCIGRPISGREIALRVRALLRGRSASTVRTQFGALVVDRGAHLVRVDGKRIQLSPFEFSLLLRLVERRPAAQSFKELRSLWTSPRRLPSARALALAVARLRRKLGQAGGHIKTVRRVGYQFVAP